MIYLLASKPSLLYFAWNLTTIVALISWSIVTSLMIFGPLAYFDKLGKILDSKEGNLEMREVVTENETPKKKSEKKTEILQEKQLKTPRLVVERPLRPKTDTFLTLPRKPAPEYTLNLTQDMLTKTMPLPDQKLLSKTSPRESLTSPVSSTRYMTIDRYV